MNETSKLGMRLAQLREARDLTQAGLAKRSEVPRSVIVRLESGQRSGVTLNTALRLANALGVSVEVLAGWDPLDRQGLK